MPYYPVQERAAPAPGVPIFVLIDANATLGAIGSAFVGSVGVCLVVVKPWRWVVAVATFIVSSTLLFTALVILFNGIAGYPVFVIERFFSFP